MRRPRARPLRRRLQVPEDDPICALVDRQRAGVLRMKSLLLAAATAVMASLVAACSSTTDCAQGDVACILAKRGAGSGANADGGTNTESSNGPACTVTG